MCVFDVDLCVSGVFAFAVDGSAVSDRLRGDAVTYVNIPTSPTSKKQLHYMELELQESSTTIRGAKQTNNNINNNICISTPYIDIIWKHVSTTE